MRHSIVEVSAMGRTEKELADLIGRRLGLPVRTARAYLRTLLELVREDLKDTGRSELRGLGTFAVHDRPALDSVHPKTGQPVHIPDRKAIRFRASKELKEMINLPKPEPPKKSSKRRARQED